MGETYTYKHIPEITPEVYQRFWSKATLTANPDKCWEWNGWVRDEKKPYGRFSINWEIFSAPRLAYFIHFKVDPKEFHVLHKCDNPRCVNPDHLFLGTNADNVSDKVSKGRQARNECWNKGKETKFRLWDNANCRATKKDFIKMKELYESKKMSVNELAIKYGIAKKVVSKGIRALGGIVPKIHRVLTEAAVLEIRQKYKKNEVCGYQLSEEYNIGQKTIMDIVHRKTWKHI